jgi:hypothetical protein
MLVEAMPGQESEVVAGAEAAAVVKAMAEVVVSGAGAGADVEDFSTTGF